MQQREDDTPVLKGERNGLQTSVPSTGTGIESTPPLTSENLQIHETAGPAEAEITPPASTEPDISFYTEVVFKGERRGYYINATGIELSPAMYVIVEAEKGVDLGVVGLTGTQAFMKWRMRSKQGQDVQRKILRIADENDVSVLRMHREQERSAFHVCLEKIAKLGLPMKLVDVEFQFDRNRITFYFTADGRVDFRELVRELAAEYRTRIELRQIGPRDEAKRIGGYGVCGRELCCTSWLDAFEPISTDMAKLQNLSLNPFKLAGQCGRLKCCLAFERKIYEQLLERFPSLDDRISTPNGYARIEKIDIFQDVVFLHYEKSDTVEKLTLEDFNRLIDKAGS
ncbi:MAG: regulatory iron-sulfur-containing complex subunit RicT [Bacteroidota bacterium]|nr:regulatory iron-sulfur-containing complex subunit RicT [Bacteroidota bacterium]